MASSKRVRVHFVGDKETAVGGDQGVAIAGVEGSATVGDEGIAFAGSRGKAKSSRYGVAIAGPLGTAEGGAGTLAFAYDGGSASGGDGAVAWARRGGPAEVNSFSVAVAMDGSATANVSSIAYALNRNGTKTRAQGGRRSVAIVRTHPEPSPNAKPAVAVAAECGVAIAYDGNHVTGSLGALLVVAYQTASGKCAFAVGVVDGMALQAGVVYTVDAAGQFLATRSQRKRRRR